MIQHVIDKLANPAEAAYEPSGIRELLAHCQHEAVQAWDYWLNDIGRDEAKIVFEDDTYVVLNLGQYTRPSDYLNSYEGAVSVDETSENIVTAIHRSLARGIMNEAWADTYPYVIRKPPLWQAVEEHVVRRIGDLAGERGSVGRGADAFAVDVQGQNQQSWGTRTGRTRQAVNNSLSRGKQEAVTDE